MLNCPQDAQRGTDPCLHPTVVGQAQGHAPPLCPWGWRGPTSSGHCHRVGLLPKGREVTQGCVQQYLSRMGMGTPTVVIQEPMGKVSAPLVASAVLPLPLPASQREVDCKTPEQEMCSGHWVAVMELPQLS